MKNPERRNGRTPNGGVRSELWYLDNNGDTVETIDAATNFKIIEFNASGEVVGTTYGKM